MQQSMGRQFIQLSIFALVSAALGACGSTGELDGSDVVDNGAESEAVGTLGAELALACPPVVDPAIAVPNGNRLAFTLDATGVQIYACQATSTGYGWVFQAPEAALLNARGRVVGSHYVGPTWEYQDGSKVAATRVAGVTPDPSAIPWLLLQASTHEGNGRMHDVTFIQRLDTAGGNAPAAGTCAVGNVGEVARIDYVATYYFFEAGKPRCHCS